jgi:hypothetical protein
MLVKASKRNSTKKKFHKATQNIFERIQDATKKLCRSNTHVSANELSDLDAWPGTAGDYRWHGDR